MSVVTVLVTHRIVPQIRVLVSDQTVDVIGPCLTYNTKFLSMSMVIYTC